METRNTVYTIDEVKKHGSPTDAWIIIHGNVYDVTRYLNVHPGGLYILYNKCGGDGTESFEKMFHSGVARDLLDKMKIGVLDPTQQVSTKKKVSHKSHSITTTGSRMKESKQTKETKEPKESKEPKEEEKKPSSQHSSKHSSKKKLSASNDHKASTSTSTPSTPKSKSTSMATSNSSGSSSSLKARQQAADDTDAMLHDMLFNYGLKSSFSSATPPKSYTSAKYKNDSDEDTTSDSSSSSTEEVVGAISPKMDKCFKLRAINYLTHDTNVYVFDVSQGKKLDLPLGHHICLYVMIDGERLKRSYTPIVDKPGSFELLVKTYKTRKVSDELAHMRAGDYVFARGPFGHFRYDPEAKYSRVCMYAAGTGITPHYQILAHASKNKTATKFELLYTNKDVGDILLKKKFDSWTSSKSFSFKVTYFLTRAKDGSWSGETGRITSDSVQRLIKPSSSDEKELHLICGPDGFRDTMEAILRDLKIDGKRIVSF